MTLSTSNKLLTLARHAMQQAYSPYSNFKVGVSIRSSNNNYYSGANIENVSYSLVLCAEATAIAHMVQAGDREIAEVLVISSGELPCPPCGACRQRILEFATPKTLIHICDAKGIYKSLTIEQLLPESFAASVMEV